MTTLVQPAISAGSLVPNRLFDRLTARITADHGIEPPIAERIMEQTLAFLAAIATQPGHSLSPSEPVDIGWHTFILYTREYAEFCQRVAGRFIHHVPNDDPNARPGDADPMAVRTRTLAAVQSAGYAIDPELWPVKAVRCHDCHKKGCGGSGPEGNENTETHILGGDDDDDD